MKRESWEIEAIHPSWEVFDACPRCKALAGKPCRDLRAQFAMSPAGVHIMRNPHSGRKKIKK